MNKINAIAFLESSFLQPLLFRDDITDISYNGVDIFYVDNVMGRQHSHLQVKHAEVADFIRQIANLMDKQFSYSVPYLDISVGRYRLLAVHSSIGRLNDGEVLTFSLRIGSIKNRIDEDKNFLTPELKVLLKVLIDSHLSILIGGTTGSGKTEFQKYLISLMDDNQRIIIIDNVLELDCVRDYRLDVTSWQVDEKNVNASAQLLIKAALRCNPDWLFVAEARGSEMLDVLNSAMTGLPIITTMHARSIDTMTDRVISMIMMNDKKMRYEDIQNDVLTHFNVYVYLSKETLKNGMINRYINEIQIVGLKSIKICIYKNSKNKAFYGKIPAKLVENLHIQTNNDLFIKTFLETKND